MLAVAPASPSSAAPAPPRRLRARRDFQAVMREAHPRRHRLLVLRARPNGLDHTRLGLSVSRRVGNAVVRNRVRRRLREAMRTLPFVPGHDIVVTASPAAADATYDEIRRACARTSEQSGVIAMESG